MRPIKLRSLEIRERLYHRRYLVPNLVTVCNMFCGFLTIMYAATGRFEKAGLAIGMAILLDGVDGRVARSLNATSRFGVEFDSLSDLVSFGVAPAVLIYSWAFYPQADDFGVFMCFTYVLCAASRLARFNISQENLAGFQGLPTPGAAGLIGALVYFAPKVSGDWTMVSFGTAVVGSLSFLMISKIPFFSVKNTKIKGMRWWIQLIGGAAIALIWYKAQVGFLVLAAAYCASGPLLYWKLKLGTLPESQTRARFNKG